LAAVAGERIRLDVQEREELGSRVTRRLRKQGLIPGILYGRGNKPRAIAIPARELRRVLTGSHGLHAILDVAVDGQKTTHASILKDYQQHPLRGEIIHVDLHEVRLDQPIHATVTVELVGDSPGVREGGVLTQAAREVNVEALPMEVPDRLELDVSGLGVGDAVRVSDLTVSEGVVFLDDPDTVIATVTTASPTLEPDEMLEEGEAAQRPADGEAPAKASEAQSDAGSDDAAGSPGTVPG
jgi:large subunit ribosomal protein L25